MVYMKLVLIPLNRVIVIELKNKAVLIESLSLNPLLVKRSGCVSNHSLREIGSLLLNKGKSNDI